MKGLDQNEGAGCVGGEGHGPTSPDGFDSNPDFPQN